MQTAANNTLCVFSLDNIRFSMVLCVVLVHAVAAYTTVIPWWYVRDRGATPYFDVIVIVPDLFQVPVLFFIAGYFALRHL